MGISRSWLVEPIQLTAPELAMGELRNMWKPTTVLNLWFHGGNLHQSRHYSRYMALQLKARMEGLDTPVYEANPVAREQLGL